MENSPLHAQKVAILSRLVKETSLTLEEALLLLKEEEPAATPVKDGPWGIGTSSPWIQPYGNGLPFTTTTGGTYTFHQDGNTVLNNTIATASADLNN